MLACRSESLSLLQVVVLAGGANDWNGGSYMYSIDQWVTMAADFVQRVSISSAHKAAAKRSVACSLP